MRTKGAKNKPKLVLKKFPNTMTPRKAHDFHGFHPYDDRRVVKLKDQDPPYSVLAEQVKDLRERLDKKKLDTLDRLYLVSGVAFLFACALVIHIIHYGI